MKTKKKIKKYIKKVRLVTNTCLTAEHLLLAMIEPTDTNIKYVKSLVESIYSEFGYEAIDLLDSIIVDSKTGTKKARFCTRYSNGDMKELKAQLDNVKISINF